MSVIESKAQVLNSKESIHEQALRLRTRRFELLASNIANADTPHYKARDIDFSTELARAMEPKSKFPGLAKTSPAHLQGNVQASLDEALYRVPFQSSMDGNTVEMDVERVAFAENALRLQFSLQKTFDKYKNILDLYKNMTR